MKKPLLAWMLAGAALTAPLLLATTKTIPTTTYHTGQSATETNGDAIQTGSSATVTVQSGAAVTYQSGTSVTLYPGFHASSGSNFDAFINTSLIPSLPTNLEATSEATTYINLLWTPSTDAAGVTTYKIYRGGSLIGLSGLPSYTDTTVTAGSSYTYAIVAVDALGQMSSSSATLTVSALSSIGSENAQVLLGTNTGINDTDSGNTMLFHVLRPQ